MGSAVLAQDSGGSSGGSSGGGTGSSGGDSSGGTASTGAGAEGGTASSGIPGTPGVGLEPGWTVVTSLGFQVTGSDNVDQDPDGLEEKALIIDSTPGISIRSIGPRFTSAYDIALTFRQQSSGDDKGLSVLPAIVGSGTAELWKNRFFVDSSSSISSVLLDSSDQDSESNREIVQTNTITPRLVQRLGNVASSELAFTYSRVDVSSTGGGDDGDDVNDTETMALGLTIENGSLGPSRLGWTIVASASKAESENDVDDTDRREIRLDTEYFIIRSLSLLGSIGYQTFDDGNPANDVDDLTWNAGVHWTPGSRTDVRLTYGQRDADESFNGELSYLLGASTRISASYSEVLQTGEEEFVNNLSFLSADPNTGELIDDRTGLPFSGDPNAVSNDSDAATVRTFSAAIVSNQQRDTYSVSAVAQERDEDGADDETSFGINSSYGRALSDRASIDFGASYQNTQFDIDGQEDDEYTLGASYQYQIFENLTAFSSYEFLTQDSNVAADEFTENRVTIGAGMTF